LSDGKETSHLQWLPATISGIYVKCVVSTVENARSLQILHDLSPSPWELIVRPLNTSTRIDIVQHYLGRYSKRLDPNQLALLTKCDGAKNALWLTLACEELRVFGVFERLTQRIQTLPGKLEGLLSDILNRLVKEDLTDCIAKVLSLLYCSQAGLLETELQMLLGDVESNTPLPMLPWAQVRRTLKPFLRNIGLVGGVERWDFFHQSIAKAVEDHWLQDVENRKNCHLELADFYQYYNNNNFAVTQNLPYHLQRAGQIQRMVEFFQKDQRSLQMNQAHKSQYLRDSSIKEMLATTPSL
uniref:TPR repeat-containing protein DDB_G0287407-like n=1 Tax=Saccoglossus kowalevskii TaxID=10224 RepID=A0ABM0MLN7_SACKO